MTVEQLIRFIDEKIPKTLSEEWDNDGCDVIPDKDAHVTRVLCALDCTSVAIEQAKALGCNVIVTHHPLIFKPLNALVNTDSVGKRVIECIKNGIAVISCHTRLDIIAGGVNDTLAGYLGLSNIEDFVPYGRIGDIDEQRFEDFAKFVSKQLEITPESLQLVKATEKSRRVAIVSGSGKDEINAAIAAGADTFVTGEVMHNNMIDCKELGLNLICATHYATERIVIPVLSDILCEVIPTNIYTFTREEEYGI